MMVGWDEAVLSDRFEDISDCLSHGFGRFRNRPSYFRNSEYARDDVVHLRSIEATEKVRMGVEDS